MWKPETIKLLEENKSSILLDISLSKFAGGVVCCLLRQGQSKETKGINQIKKILHRKENNQNKKAAF